MLGDRIRKIRKQKKMTLDALAGTELTKGMLSLIENNKANPSMESLTYIAQQLGVEMADLLGEVSSEELREVLERTEKIFNTPLSDFPDKYMQLIKLIEPFMGKLSQGYESARLMEVYSYALHHEKREGWEKFLGSASDIFDQINISSNRTSIGIYLSSIPFWEHDYTTALEIFMIERKHIEARYSYIEPMARLDLDYHEAILLYAVGDYEAAIETMEKAVAFSREKRLFYLIDDLYRLAAAHALMEDNKKERDYYLKKLKQYGEFADHAPSIHFYHLFQIIILISDKREYEKALKEIDVLVSDPKMKEFYYSWFNLEKAKALYYLKRFDEALETINEVAMLETHHHPIDLSNFYIKDSYKALILLELGRRNDAVTAARIAVDKLQPLPESRLQRFGFKVLEKVTAQDPSSLEL